MILKSLTGWSGESDAMRKRGVRRKWSVLLFIAGLLACLVFSCSRSNEPAFEGKLLSEWVIAYPYIPADDRVGSEEEVAIRAIGTNSLPFLLYWTTLESIEENPVMFKLRMIALKIEAKFNLHHLPIWNYRHRVERRIGAYEAFGALGELAAPALPVLVERFTSPE